ncbi:MAG: hypothetical protein LN413_00530 [Candidatus Thermoplasmatota archaeon]|nr:hypothetical protein [Candidatus Thermoplasmatota archaeon]
MSKKDKEWEQLYLAAHDAGMEAGSAHAPTPMVVVQHENQLDDSSPVAKMYPPVMDGACGFAWVNVRPGTSSFARWLRKSGEGHSDHYAGGTAVWVPFFNQSYERKMAYARAMADVLDKAGVKAYAGGRLD